VPAGPRSIRGSSSSKEEALARCSGATTRRLGRRGSCDFAGGMLAFDGYPVNRLTTGCGRAFHDLEGGLAAFEPIHKLWIELILIVWHGLLLSL
jgi:hypothetical protein